MTSPKGERISEEYLSSVMYLNLETYIKLFYIRLLCLIKINI